MTTDERVDFLQGQIQALVTFAFAVIETHPDRKALKTAAATNLEAALAKLGGGATPEAGIDGLLDMKERLEKFASTW